MNHATLKGKRPFSAFLFAFSLKNFQQRSSLKRLKIIFYILFFFELAVPESTLNYRKSWQTRQSFFFWLVYLSRNANFTHRILNGHWKNIQIFFPVVSHFPFGNSVLQQMLRQQSRCTTKKNK